MSRRIPTALVRTALLVTGLLHPSNTSPAPAQTVEPIAEPGTQVFVALDDGGTVLAGSLVSLSDKSLAILMTSGPRDIPYDDVVRIERRGDRTFDGAVRGASILGGLCVLNCGQGLNNSGQWPMAVLANAAVGAVIGWWFDRAHVGRTVIYQRR